MPSLSEIAIGRPVFTWMLMAALILFGGISFFKLGISRLPDTDFPIVHASFSLPGAAPEVMEAQVLDPVEDSIMQIGGIRNLSSNAQQGSASVTVEFELNRDIDQALEEVSNRIDQVRNFLPSGLLPSRLRKINPEDQPILWLGLSAMDPKTPLIDLMAYAKDKLENQFATLPGVGDIVVGGYVDPALRVWLDSKKLNSFDFTSSDIIHSIQQEQVEIPAGHLQNDRNEFHIRVRGEASRPEDFGRIRIAQRLSQGINYKPIFLKDVARIEEATGDIRRISRMDGKLSVGLGFIKQHGANAVAVAESIREKLAQIRTTVPEKFELSLRSDSTHFIKESVDQLLFTLGLSAAVTSLVCFFFLGSWTSTLNVLMAIPTSIIGTFVAFYFFGFTLNTFTLLGLSLAIGIVVDDAIMMLENIVRHRELGDGKKAAALNGTKEISFAALASTLAIAAIFLPVVFMKGVMGRYFFQYGLTVTIAVAFSLFEALTLTPMRCSRYLEIPSSRRKERALDQAFHKLAKKYEFLLKVLLKHRWKTLLVALIFFLSSLGIGKYLPSEMMPSQDQSMFMVRFKLPVGTALGVTDQKIKEVEEYLLSLPEVKGVFSVVGGFGGDAVNQGMAYVTLKDRRERKTSQSGMIRKVRTELRNRTAGMQNIVQDLSLRGFTASRGFPVELVILRQGNGGSGQNWEELRKVTERMINAMRESGYLADVTTDVQSGMPEIQIKPDRKKLAEHAVSLNKVTEVIQTLMAGSILTGGNEFSKSNHRYPIIVKLQHADRNRILDLNRVMVRNNRGQRIPLSSVADLQLNPSPLQISRMNRKRAVTVYANVSPEHSQQEAIEMVQKIARSVLPPGYGFKMIGSSQSYRESMQSLILALVLGIVVSYMVLGAQFNSFVHPIAVLMALPFSFSGALLSLALGHQSINIYSMMGFILLMGIVKKNSILLVDFTNRCRSRKDFGQRKNVDDALLQACPIRLRPILMTSIATIAAALPEALSFGPGAETIIPMATAVIGGVVASTVLTLFVVPCAYSLLSKLESAGD